ncbi:nicotinate-nucleotide--dimethylbenzimidazole phosphoribosyltransferase [uncultured Methylobacterium sp.]|uniref:nicotinate-nucleotide--dimethylbenzimidazole phosphoribosyltransferase n=1 Tax=uncultured Methylobacterium sp. TaxID=157278 RepID=UPI0035CC97B4
MTDESPFADIRGLIAGMPGPDRDAVAMVRERDAMLTKPAGALGRLEQLVEWLAAWQAKGQPSLDRPLVCVFAGSHGVVARGVSAYPADVNRQMLDNFAAGGGAINQICAAYGLGFKVFDLAIDLPTGDICAGPAFSEKDCVATMAFGMEAVAAGTDCLALGEMGIGNTTIAAAIYAALYGGDPAHWVGRGTGVDEAGLARKTDAVAAALVHHRGHLDDPLEVLARLGGREIAAMAGAILAARLQRVPVVLDGYVATAAAAILHAVDATALDHCLSGHVSAEGAHAEVLERLGLVPLLALGMRLGEGSGAAMALGLLKGALACHRDMATFAQAGVSGRDQG